MQSRDLTFAQVAEVGLKAFNDLGVALDGHGPGRLEAVFEFGSVWLQDEDKNGRVRSARLMRRDEIPQSGWRHDRNCECPYCAVPVETEP